MGANTSYITGTGIKPFVAKNENLHKILIIRNFPKTAKLTDRQIGTKR